MKLLLTSGGITNKSIANSLRRLLGKPFNKSRLVFIPTAANITSGDKSWLINDFNNCEKLGFKEIDILNIDSTPQEKFWRPRIEAADVILFGGGNTFYLMRWMWKSGLAKALPKFLKTKVYVGISAGSIATGPDLSLSSKKNRDVYALYYEDEPKISEKALGFVNFHIRPHLNSPHFPLVRLKRLKEIAKEKKEPIYAIDDNSAIEVVNRKIRIVSEGRYSILN